MKKVPEKIDLHWNVYNTSDQIREIENKLDEIIEYLKESDPSQKI